MGAIDGAMVGQIVGGQIGGRSIAFWQSGSICPSMHWQTHSASALQIPSSRNATAASCTRMFESLPPRLRDRLAFLRRNLQSSWRTTSPRRPAST